MAETKNKETFLIIPVPWSCDGKWSIVIKATYLSMLVIILDCEDERLCLYGYRYTVQTQQILYVLTCWLNSAYLRPHALAQEVICSVWGTYTLPFLTQWQSVVGKGSIQYSKSLNLPLGLNVIVQALHTNTSSVRSCLLQHLFIDCLVTLYE